MTEWAYSQLYNEVKHKHPPSVDVINISELSVTLLHSDLTADGGDVTVPHELQRKSQATSPDLKLSGHLGLTCFQYLLTAV